MPETYKTKIWVSTYNLPSGCFFTIPIIHPEIIWMNSNDKELADKLAKIIEKGYCKNGEYAELLQKLPQLQFEHQKVSVTIEPAVKDSFLPVKLYFDMFQTQIAPLTYMGFVPVLQLVSTGKTPEELFATMQSNIRLYYSRTSKNNDLYEIISTQCFSDFNFRAVDVSVETYTLKELRNLDKLNKNKILPRVAKVMNEKQKSAFLVDDFVKKAGEALSGKFSRSVLVTGRPGVGKTALIRELLYQKSNSGEGDFPTVWETNASFLINKLIGETGWQENLAEVCSELRDSGNILYVENFADLFEVGQYEGNNVSIAEALLENLKRGEITLISECTADELAAIELRSPGYSALFYVLRLEEPPLDDLLRIIQMQVNRTINEEGNILVEEDAVQTALQLQKRFTPYSGFPGKTIRFFENLMIEKEGNEQIVFRSDVFDAFCEETGMPRILIDADYPFSFDEMEAHFRTNIFGQDEAVQVVVDMLATVKAGLVRQEKPIASLLFIGPTGVGKTELAKVLAEYVFGSRKRVIRFDMSEYSDISQVLRLSGSHYESRGLLVDAVRQDPFSVVLFDELEKAHPVFYDLLLQILGEGRLTDARGNVADFCSTIIIMTSNIGAASVKYSVSGFNKQFEGTDKVTNHFFKEVQKFFRPELFNRLDRIVGFLPLSREVIRKVVDREIHLVKKREGLLFRNIDLNIATNALDKLGTDGYDETYGARQLQRTIRKELVIPLAKALNAFDFEKPLKADVFIDNKKIAIKVEERIIPKAERKPTSADSMAKMLIDGITTSRRELQLIHNSTNLTDLLSQLDILIVKKRKLKERFFAMQKMLEVFYKLESIKNKLTDMSDRINEIERLAMGYYFDLISYGEISKTDYPQWQIAFMALKMEIFQFSNPLQNKITLAIYGNYHELEQLFYLYKFLCQKHKFKIEFRAVYLNHCKKKTNLFTYEDRKSDTFIFSDETRNDLIGIESEISGEAVRLYFQSEEGTTEFLVNGQKERCKVIVSGTILSQFTTPTEIIRKKAFEATTEYPLRRFITPDGMKDTNYKLDIQEIKDMPAKLADYLDTLFEEQLLDAICNGRRRK